MEIGLESLPKSIHFELDEVADGIFAAYALKGGAAMGNAGIIDLGDRSLVFDSTESPLAAEDLRVANEVLTGKSPSWLVNSHAHADHWFGNQVFSDETIIIASKLTCAGMPEYIEEVEQEKLDPSEMIAYIQELKDQSEKEDDQQKREIIQASIARFNYNLESLPNLQLRMPDQCFEGQMEIIGSQRKVSLIDVGAAHTPGDTYLVIEAENIAFLGDLGFFQEQPFMADCDPEGWLECIQNLENSSIKKFIPGHGRTGTKTDLKLLEKYIKFLISKVTQAKSVGNTPDWVLSQSLPEPFQTWALGSQRLEINVKFLFEYLEKGD